MKKFFTMMIMVLAVAIAMAQAPEKFSYQAVVRNASNALVTNAQVGVRVSILQGSASGNAVYVETHTANTNTNGLLTIEIGGGTVQQGVFANIDWANGPYFLKTETDPNGGSSYSITSVQQLLSVPYALYAKDAGNVPTVPVNVSAFTNDAGYITAQDIPEIPTVPTNVSAFVNDVPYMTSFTEQQILTISNDTIFLTGGSFVKLPEGFNGDYNSLTNTPSIPTVPTNVSAFVNDMGYLTSFTEQQVLSISNDTIFLTGGSFVKLPAGFDGDYNSLTNTPTIPTVPTDVSVFNNDANYVSNTECADVDLCALAALVSSLQGQLTELQGQLAELQSTIDSLTVPDTTVTPVATLPTVITDAVSDITETTATCGGEVIADGGVAVTERGVCWSTSATPTVADNHTSDGAGLGTFTSNITGLTASTTYYVRAYAINSVGTAYGETVTFTTEASPPVVHGQPCPGTPTVTDYDGNIYNTVLIGTQCWTKENLRTTHYADGTAIPAGGSNTSYTEPYYYDYSTHSLPLETRGYLYNWSAAMHGAASSNANPSGVQGICPAGWHLPSDAEWTQLTNYVGSQSEYTCGGNSSYIAKALASETGWNSHTNACAVGNDPTSNNASGFSVVPAGYWDSGFTNAGNSAAFWSSTEGGTYNAWSCNLYYSDADVYRDNDYRHDGFSVRCLHNEGGTDTIQATLPTVITSAVSDITEITATCGGEVTSDGGAAVTARGVCWSTSASPTVADNHTSDGTGLGTFTSNITGLTANTTYYVRAYATNSVGTFYGETVTFTTEASTPVVHGQPCPEFATVTDYDGNTYNTVQIGQQCWMRENLRTTHYASGTAITAGGSTTSNTEPYYYDYSSQNFPLEKRGYLYNWPAVMHGVTSSNTNPIGVQGICPNGWHLPSDAEWTLLTDYVSSQPEYTCGGNSSYIAKALASVEGWGDDGWDDCHISVNLSTNNTSGFSAFPAGQYWNGFFDLGYGALFWSSTTDGSNNGAYIRDLFGDGAVVYRDGGNWDDGYSVRCLRDEGGYSASLPTIITSEISDITETTVTCGGEVIADGGAEISERGVCWGISTNPTIADAHTSNGTGMGTFISNIIGLSANTTYFVRAFATNIVGTTYGETMTFTTVSSDFNSQPCPGTPTVTDYDSNTYNTVQIGDQCWMRENLRTTHYADGTAISAGGSTTSISVPYYYVNSPLDAAVYGYYYNWAAAMHGTVSSALNPSGVQGICPTGWHLPSDEEWTQLTNYVGGQSEYTCGSNSSRVAKALASTEGWNTTWNTCVVGHSPNNNNTTGFSAVPAGYWSGSSFNAAGNSTHFWSSTETGSETDNTAYERSLDYNGESVRRGNDSKIRGFSVRCIRGNSATLPTVSTSTLNDITETTATCGGEVISDGGAEVIERGICWGTSINPTVFGSHISDGMGIGTFITNISGLTAGTTYYVRAYAINSVGTAYGEDAITFTTNSSNPFLNGQPCTSTPTVTDIDGNVYNTVQIGDQCWMRENLRVMHYSDGSSIPIGVGSTSNDNPYYYVNNSLDATVYGYYYNWPAAMHGAASSSVNPSGVQGICPVGWHLPSDAEWTQLAFYVGGRSEYTCGGNSNYIAKALASTEGWLSTSGACQPGNQSDATNNASGFSIVPAGYYDYGFNAVGNGAYFWSTTPLTGSSVFGRFLYKYNAYMGRTNSHQKQECLSVRCLRDEATPPTVTTGVVRNVTEISAMCNGEVTDDGGVEVTERGICWGTSSNPTIVGNHVVSGTGSGAFTVSLSGITASTTYYVRAYATNSVGTAYGEELTFTTTNSNDGQPCSNFPNVTDIDGNTYNTVQIGNQCWMRENLRTTHYSDGTAIPIGDSVISFTEPYYYDYSSHSLPLETRGYLYNWPAAMHSANNSNTNPNGTCSICPTGWHLPSDAEWTTLTNYVGSQNEYIYDSNINYIAKALASTDGWNSSNDDFAIGNDQAANNTTGFSAVPAGLCYGSSFSYAEYSANFWSSTQNANYYSADGRSLDNNNAIVHRDGNYKCYGRSVRCLHDGGTDTTQATLPTVITGAVSGITETTVTCGGEVTSDGGAAVTARGVCWSTSATPTVADAHTSDGTGIGTFTSNITGLTANTTYYVRAYATNSVGTFYGETVTFTTEASTPVVHGQPCPGVPTVTDIDGNIYNTVQIGQQCWMRENLRTTHYADGTTIPAGGSNYSYTEPYYYDYSTHSLPLAQRGYLYNWPAAMHGAASSTANPSGVQGICPAGWHLPSDAEWSQLENYVGGQSEYTCGGNSSIIAKALASETGWNSYSSDCVVGNDLTSNNATGFSAVPAGSCYGSSFTNAGLSTYFWSSTQDSGSNAWYRTLDYRSEYVGRGNGSEYYGFSVRCLRD